MITALLSNIEVARAPSRIAQIEEVLGGLGCSDLA